MLSQDALIDRIASYDPNVDAHLLGRVYDYGKDKHGEQKRANGDPYYSHPVAVAAKVIDWRLDWQAVATALLHDVVEDTDGTVDEVADLFGVEVGELVDGVTKLGQLELSGEGSKSAENFRKLFLAMSRDIRVLLVKLADRLHNMETLHFIPKPEKRQRIARETLDIYAPLAERIGMERVKARLQDIAFSEINTDARKSILERTSYLRDACVTQQIIDELTQKLFEQGIRATITGRVKEPFSIWMKMQQKAVEFEQLSDIMAFRIVVEDVMQCYAALGILHASYQMVPGRFKDYISTPKNNGYRSIHTGVVGPTRELIEVQIRTEEMQSVNEEGVAAHWAYKQEGDATTDGQQYGWVRNLLDILESAESPDDFLEHTKLEMFRDQVFAFTPKGRLISLPAGSTPIDFAYAVHTGVGDTCVGAKINGRIRPLQTLLKNGDSVDVLTQKGSAPSPDWEAFVATGKAKSCIRRAQRFRQREQYEMLGRTMLEQAAKVAETTLNDKKAESVLTHFACENVDDLYFKVGSGRIQGREVAHRLFPEAKPSQNKRPSSNVVSLLGRRKSPKRPQRGNSHSLPVKGLIPGMAMHFGRCCHPLPGDRIVGIVTTGRGVTVHTLDCDTLERFQEQPERWLQVSWEDEETAEAILTGRLNVTLANEPGSLAEITTVIGKNEGNISNLRMVTRTNDFFEMLIDVEVEDTNHLSNIVAALRANRHITEVTRSRN